MGLSGLTNTSRPPPCETSLTRAAPVTSGDAPSQLSANDGAPSSLKGKQASSAITTGAQLRFTGAANSSSSFGVGLRRRRGQLRGADKQFQSENADSGDGHLEAASGQSTEHKPNGEEGEARQIAADIDSFAQELSETSIDVSGNDQVTPGRPHAPQQLAGPTVTVDQATVEPDTHSLPELHHNIWAETAEVASSPHQAALNERVWHAAADVIRKKFTELNLPFTEQEIKVFADQVAALISESDSGAIHPSVDQPTGAQMETSRSFDDLDIGKTDFKKNAEELMNQQFQMQILQLEVTQKMKILEMIADIRKKSIESYNIK